MHGFHYQPLRKNRLDSLLIAAGMIAPNGDAVIVAGRHLELERVGGVESDRARLTLEHASVPRPRAADHAAVVASARTRAARRRRSCASLCDF
jgi:hypothetical protein